MAWQSLCCRANRVMIRDRGAVMLPCLSVCTITHNNSRSMTSKQHCSSQQSILTRPIRLSAWLTNPGGTLSAFWCYRGYPVWPDPTVQRILTRPIRPSAWLTKPGGTHYANSLTRPIRLSARWDSFCFSGVGVGVTLFILFILAFSSLKISHSLDIILRRYRIRLDCVPPIVYPGDTKSTNQSIRFQV